MLEKILTDSSSEKITIKWDGTRFALVEKRKGNDIGVTTSIILLSPKEMMSLVEFAGKLGGE